MPVSLLLYCRCCCRYNYWSPVVFLQYTVICRNRLMHARHQSSRVTPPAPTLIAVPLGVPLQATVPKTLTQQYLFMPQQMKTCFVVQVLFFAPVPSVSSINCHCTYVCAGSDKRWTLINALESKSCFFRLPFELRNFCVPFEPCSMIRGSVEALFRLFRQGSICPAPRQTAKRR